MTHYDNIKLTKSQIKCDNPVCDYRVDIDPHELELFVDEMCPKCGQILLTEEDYIRGKTALLAAALLNTRSPEQLAEEAKSSGHVKDNPMFRDTKGMEHLDKKQQVIFSVETHKEIKVAEIKPAAPLPPDPYPELLSKIATLFSEGKGNEEIVQVLREEWVISKK